MLCFNVMNSCSHQTFVISLISREITLDGTSFSRKITMNWENCHSQVSYFTLMVRSKIMFTFDSRKFWSQPITTVYHILKILLKLLKSLILRVFSKMLDIFGPNMTHFKKTLCVCVLLSESESNLSHKGKFRDPTISRKNPHEPMAKTVTLPAIEMICIRRYVGRRITWFYSYDCKKVPHLKN